MSASEKAGDEGPLPDLHQGLLDDATVDQLFRDLASFARILEIIPKFADRRPVEDGASVLSLEEARSLLQSGAVRGVQVRYQHEGAQWWDTLMRTPQGVRLVRIRHEFPAP